jgi:hypothetical protein
MKLRISNISLCLLPLFLWSFQVLAQIPGTVQFDANNFAQELIRENRERLQGMQRERAEIAALDQPMLAQQKALETLEQESYIRLNLNRCLQAQLPRGFCNLLIQPPWNQP